MALVFDGGLIDLTSGAPAGGAPWVSNTYKLTLVTSAFVASVGMRYASAFSGTEISTVSFTAGFGGLMRRPLSAAALSYNTTSHQMEFYASTIVWSGLSGGSVGGAVLLRESGTDAVSPIIAYYPFTNVTTNGGDFIVSAPTSGFLVLSAA